MKRVVCPDEQLFSWLIFGAIAAIQARGWASNDENSMSAIAAMEETVGLHWDVLKESIPTKFYDNKENLERGFRMMGARIVTKLIKENLG